MEIKRKECFGFTMSAAVAACAAFSVLTASAALKYETDSYVQDGLVLHLDGIRNVGALKAHDPAAIRWADLSGSDNWANFVRRADTDQSAWTDNGYFFAGMSYAMTENALPELANTTIEAYGHFPRSKQSTDGGFSSTFISAESASADLRVCRAIGAFMVQWITDSYGAGYWDSGWVRPSVSNWNETDFACLMTDTTAAMYENCADPTQKRGFSMDRDTSSSIHSSRWVLANSGFTKSGTPDYLNGSLSDNRFVNDTSSYSRQAYCTYNALRIYNRALTDKELAANNALDIIRYKTGIPVTNAVVVTSVSGVEGVEPAGAYAVDGNHVFSVPACVKSGGKTYAAAGYLREVWNGDAGTWGEAEECSGRFCPVSEDEKVRITWQWEETAGSLGELSAADYIQDGLVLHFDGVENAGLGKPHDPYAATWKDLSSSGNDVVIEHLTSSLLATDARSRWNEDGYCFNGNSYGITESAMNIAPDRKVTVQTVTTFVPGQQKRSYPAPFGTTEDYCNIYTYSTGANLQLKIFNISGQNTVVSSWGGRYATAMIDQGNKRLFQTVLPSTPLESGTSTKEMGERYWYVGSAGLAGSTGMAGRSMIGTVHAVRAYSRVLADDELKWNRIIDDYRFFGESTGVLATNAVVVTSELEGQEGREPNGMYLPEGWTFQMADQGIRTIGDKDYAIDGYVLETWDAETETWTDPVTNTQDHAWTSPAAGGTWPSVRLTWKFRVVRGLLPVPDVDDYVQDGLLIHLDGFRNAGAGVPHDTTATEWINLAGSSYASITQAGDDGSAWTGDGYFFGGKSVATMSDAITLMPTVSVQVACGNVDLSEQVTDYPTIMGLTGTRDSLNIYWNSAVESWYLKAGEYIAGERSQMKGDYFTAIYTDERRAFFETTVPASWSTWERKITIGTITPVFGGGRGHFQQPYDDWYLVGEIKNVRIYDRVLTDAELELNRAVDEARRAHKPDVEVADGACGAMFEAPGLYEVQGTWTFTATNVVDKFGCHRTVTGYTLETAQDGVWGEPVRYSGASYVHDTEQTDGFVRLTWKLSPRGLRIILR